MKRPSKKRQNDEINVIMCFRPSDFDYNDELARNGCTVSGLFVAAATSCQADNRQISLPARPIIYAEPIDSWLTPADALLLHS